MGNTPKSNQAREGEIARRDDPDELDTRDGFMLVSEPDHPDTEAVITVEAELLMALRKTYTIPRLAEMLGVPAAEFKTCEDVDDFMSKLTSEQRLKLYTDLDLHKDSRGTAVIVDWNTWHLPEIERGSS